MKSEDVDNLIDMIAAFRYDPSIDAETFVAQLEKLRTYIEDLEQKVGELKIDIRVMVEKAAEEHLPAYREQGEKMLKVVQQNEAMKEYMQSMYANGPFSSHWVNFLLLNPEYK